MNKAYLLVICLLAASFTGCIEEELENATEEDSELKKAIYAVLGDLENGNWESFCKMFAFVVEEDNGEYIVTLGNEAQIKECVEDIELDKMQAKYTINDYKEKETDEKVASNSGPIYEVTMDMETCVKYDSAESWDCETEKDISYFTKVSGQWIDITDEWLEASLEQGESAPIATFFVEQDSTNVYHVTVVKVSRQENLEDFSFYLKNENGNTYVAGNGFGEIAMQIIDGKEHGIDATYQGDDQQLKSRADAISDDDGSDFPVHFSDNDRDGKLSAGDQFLVYGPEAGPVEAGWKLDVQYNPSGDIIGSAKLGEYTGDVGTTGADWTFMTYISDSDLEYFSIEDMVEMERVGSTDKVNIVVQIDRWDGYDKPDSNDDSNGDWETAKRYLITKENKDDHVIGSTAIEDIGEINTGDPKELVEFVQWAQTNYPAEHYALNIWNHGSGATGVAYEQSCPDYCWYYGNDADKLELSEIDSALSQITNNGENKLDIVGFDACLMSTIEVVEAVAPYSDIMIGSEILEPGDGWDYSFLQLIVDDPSTSPEELGAKIVDTFVAQGQTSDQSYALTMLDMGMAKYTIDSINALAELKDSTSLISDLEAIRYNSVHVEPGDSSSAVDLLHLMNSLSEYTTDSKVKMAADRAAANVSAMILKAEFNGDPSDIDTTGMTGVSILFPNLENEWAKRTKGMSETSQWGELMEDYYDEQEEEQVLFFNEDSLIYDTDDLDQDGHNDSISLALEVESLNDGVYGNLTLDVFNNRGYWIDGIEYDFEMNSDEMVYIDLWDVYYIHMLEDGEADLLRIEAVLSIVNTDGTQTLQDWVETPYEYLTAFNESRELLLIDYVYFTEDQTIEPEIGDDSVYLEVAAGRVSNWSVENTDFAVDVHIDSINLWWENAGDPGELCAWTFRFLVNDASAGEYYAECQTKEKDEVNRETFIIDEMISLLVGDIFEIEIFYDGTEDFYFYFNSEEYDTGLDVTFSIP